jgi:hypothetical protein
MNLQDEGRCIMTEIRIGQVISFLGEMFIVSGFDATGPTPTHLRLCPFTRDPENITHINAALAKSHEETW